MRRVRAFFRRTSLFIEKGRAKERAPSVSQSCRDCDEKEALEYSPRVEVAEHRVGRSLELASVARRSRRAGRRAK